MCCAICLPYGRNFRWKRESLSESEYWLVCCRWTLEIKFNKSLSLSIIRLVNYSVTTSNIGDAQGFSGKTPITPSRGFSVETLTGVTLSWKTELNRSISVMEDGIPRELQYYHKTCCEKGGLVCFRGDITTGSFPDEWTCIWQCVRVCFIFDLYLLCLVSFSYIISQHFI